MAYDKDLDSYNGQAGDRDQYGDTAQTYDPTASPSEDLIISTIARSVIVAGDGDLHIVPAKAADNEVLVFTGVSLGFIPPYRVRIIKKETTCLVYTIEK